MENSTLFKYLEYFCKVNIWYFGTNIIELIYKYLEIIKMTVVLFARIINNGQMIVHCMKKIKRSVT